MLKSICVGLVGINVFLGLGAFEAYVDTANLEDANVVISKTINMNIVSRVGYRAFKETDLYQEVYREALDRKYRPLLEGYEAK